MHLLSKTETTNKAKKQQYAPLSFFKSVTHHLSTLWFRLYQSRKYCSVRHSEEMCAGRERSTDREINKTSRIKQVTPSMLGSMQILNIQINMAATERKKQDNPILLPLNQSMLSDVVLPKQLVCFEWKFLIRYATGEITVYFLICFLETLMFQPLQQICGYITHLHDSHHDVVRSTKLVYAF